MVQKDDIRRTFKDLCSVDRIELLCGMLQLCHPYELRFIGTCLEDLAQKSYNTLSEFETIANQTKKLRDAIHGKDISDPESFASLNIYLSLLHSDNISCAILLFSVLNDLKHSVLDKLEQSDDGIDCELLEKNSNFVTDVMLLFTMAYYHPAFTLDQRLQMYEVSKSIKESIRQKDNNYVESAKVEFTSEDYALNTISVKEFNFCKNQDIFVFLLEVSWSDNQMNHICKSCSDLKQFCNRLVETLGNGFHMPPFPSDLSNISYDEVIQEMNSYFRHVLILFNNADQEFLSNFFKRHINQGENIINDNVSNISNISEKKEYHINNLNESQIHRSKNCETLQPATSFHSNDSLQLYLNNPSVNSIYSTTYGNTMSESNSQIHDASMEASPFFLQTMEIQQHLQTISSIALVTTSVTNASSSSINDQSYLVHIADNNINSNQNRQRNLLKTVDNHLDILAINSLNARIINSKLIESNENLDSIDDFYCSLNDVSNENLYKRDKMELNNSQELKTDTKVIFCTLASGVSISSGIVNNNLDSSSLSSTQAIYTNNNYMFNPSDKKNFNERTKDKFDKDTITSVLNHSYDHISTLSAVSELQISPVFLNDNLNAIIDADVKPTTINSHRTTDSSLSSNIADGQLSIKENHICQTVEKSIFPTPITFSPSIYFAGQRLNNDAKTPAGIVNKTLKNYSISSDKVEVLKSIPFAVNNFSQISPPQPKAFPDMELLSSGDNIYQHPLPPIIPIEKDQISLSFLSADETFSYHQVSKSSGGGDLLFNNHRSKPARPILGQWQKQFVDSDENIISSPMDSSNEDLPYQNGIEENMTELTPINFPLHSAPPLPPYPSTFIQNQPTYSNFSLPPIAIIDNNFPPGLPYPCACSLCNARPPMQSYVELPPSIVWPHNIVRIPTSNGYIPSNRFPPPSNFRFINHSFDFPPFRSHLIPPQMMPPIVSSAVPISVQAPLISESSQVSVSAEGQGIIQKKYCFNCGAYGHLANACSEPFMLPMGQPAQFKLKTIPKSE